MGNDIKVKCTFSSLRFKSKPDSDGARKVQCDLKPTNITIKDLSDALVHGASFRPGVLYGRSKNDWKEQQLFGLDFDHNTTIEEKYNKAMMLGINPCFMYTTFSHSEEEHKFRMVFCNNKVITDGNYRDKLQATLMGIMEDADPVCRNRDRLFYGGKGQVVLHPDFDIRINAESIIEKYWKEEYRQFIPDEKIKKKKDNTSASIKNKGRKSKNFIVYEDNTDAISTLNIPLLQERLGIKGDLIGTDRRRYSLLVSTQSPEAEKSGRCENGVYQFQSEAEMYNYINSIDLQEYLGVPSGTFCCILPTHEDNKPSAHIYITNLCGLLGWCS